MMPKDADLVLSPDLNAARQVTEQHAQRPLKDDERPEIKGGYQEYACNEKYEVTPRDNDREISDAGSFQLS